MDWLGPKAGAVTAEQIAEAKTVTRDVAGLARSFEAGDIESALDVLAAMTRYEVDVALIAAATLLGLAVSVLADMSGLSFDQGIERLLKATQ